MFDPIRAKLTTRHAQSVWLAHTLDAVRAKLTTRHAQPVLLAVLAAMGFASRLAWIAQRGDTDGDSYGHWGIACNLLVEPARVDLHWVWPPVYHYWLSFLLRVHTSFAGVRILNAVLASTVPLMVFWLCKRRPSFEHVAWPSAALTFLSPLTFLSGASAQQETLFGVLILLCAYALECERAVAAGLVLAGAVLVRYEAIGACGLLTLQSLATTAWPRLRKRLGMPAPACSWALPLLGLSGWVLAHRVADGRWFAFLGELYRFTRAQRDGYSEPWLAALTWFPLRQPLHFWGPLVLLAPLAARGRIDRTIAVPVGVWFFLLASYVGRGVQANARYYVSLVPFACIAIALGWRRLDAWLSLRSSLAWPIVARHALAIAVCIIPVVILKQHLTHEWRVDDGWAIREERRANRLAAAARGRLDAAAGPSR